MPKPIPEGFQPLTPHLIVKNADKAIDFYKRAFGAKEEVCMRAPDTGKVMHAELEAFGGRFMLANADDQWKCYGPDYYKGTPVVLHFYVQDCDRAFQQALDAGAEVVQPLEDMFWGDRYGKLKDPFGHEWAIATHKKDMTPAEMQKAGERWFEEFKKASTAV